MQEIIDKLVKKVKDDTQDGETFRKSTAPVNYGGWSSTEHEAMFRVAEAFGKKDYVVSRNMNHGVMDWEISPPVTVEI